MYYCFHLSCCVCTHHTAHVDFHQDIVWLVLETGQSLSQIRRKIEPGVHKIFQKPRSHLNFPGARRVTRGKFCLRCHKYLAPHTTFIHHDEFVCKIFAPLVCTQSNMWLSVMSVHPLLYARYWKKNAKVGDKYCYGMAAFSSNFRLFIKFKYSSVPLPVTNSLVVMFFYIISKGTVISGYSV